MHLSTAQIAQFHHDGFLHVPSVFTSDDFAAIKAAINAEVDRRCDQLLAEGLITDLHKDAPFETRFGFIMAQSEEIQGGFDIDTLAFDAFFAQLSHPKLLDCIESLLGPNISINPIHHLRAKPPSKQKHLNYFSVPWHQDAGVITKETDSELIITAWYPLGEASDEMGCMRLIPGVQAGNLLPHIASEYGTAIHPDYMPDAEPIIGACAEGDVILMSQWCPHHSTPNLSNKCRWSMDTRYHVTGTPSGRDWFPATPVRDQDPRKVVTDPNAWRQAWADAKAKDNPGVVHRISHDLAVST